MACATLKRSIDWEALNQRPTKRRRCNPYASGASGSSSSSAAFSSFQFSRSSIPSEPAASAFANTPSCPKLTPGKCLKGGGGGWGIMRCFHCILYFANIWLLRITLGEQDNIDNVFIILYAFW